MTVYMYHTHLMGEPPVLLLLLGPMRKMLGLRRRRRSSRRSTTRRRRRREAADDGDRRRERLDAEGRVRGARLEPRLPQEDLALDDGDGGGDESEAHADGADDTEEPQVAVNSVLRLPKVDLLVLVRRIIIV